MPTIIPPDYQTPMGLAQTEQAVKMIKDHFESTLAAKLNLLRVSAPLFVRADDGVQVGIWPDHVQKSCEEAGIQLL